MAVPITPTYEFLSTLSLRRATIIVMVGLLMFSLYFYPRSPCGERLLCLSISALWMAHFYPRSPCGERPWLTSFPSSPTRISIHALLAESDQQHELGDRHHQKFLSTLSLRRATRTGYHGRADRPHFYPRSPCGERPNNVLPAYAACGISIHALLAESDALGAVTSPAVIRFLSTLSLRRATDTAVCKFCKARISIHALLAESDVLASIF